jgi:hypothetical protein
LLLKGTLLLLHPKQLCLQLGNLLDQLLAALHGRVAELFAIGVVLVLVVEGLVDFAVKGRPIHDGSFFALGLRLLDYSGDAFPPALPCRPVEPRIDGGIGVNHSHDVSSFLHFESVIVNQCKK